jgi:hypothetical protein
MAEVKPLRDSSGRWLPGQQGGATRKRGQLSKHTVAVKQIIEDVFSGLGGVPAMISWAKENPNLFYGAVLPKLIPAQLRLDATVSSDIAGVLERARNRVLVNNSEFPSCTGPEASTHDDV